MPLHSCASCSVEFSSRYLPRELPNCKHTICEHCADRACTQLMGFRCPLCKASINVRSVTNFSKDSSTLSMDLAKSFHQEEKCNRAHIIGHKWLLQLRKVSDEHEKTNMSRNIKFSFELLSGNVFIELIQMARSGKLKQHQHVVVFACIPFAWRVCRPSQFQNLTLFLPNTDFNYQSLKVNINTLMEALTAHRSDTKLHLFLPPVVDIDRFNRLQIQQAQLNYDTVAATCREILPYYILNHTRSYFKNLHPKHFNDMPSNIHFIHGKKVVMRVSSNVCNGMMHFINEKTNALQLEEIFKNGVDPSYELASELYTSICKSIIYSTQTNASFQNNSSPYKFFSQTESGANEMNSNLDNISQGNNVQESDISPYKQQESFQASKHAMSDESLSFNSIKNTKMFSVEDSKHLMDATSEEILRSAEHLKAVRDICYPSVTNEELAQVAFKAVQQYFR